MRKTDKGLKPNNKKYIIYGTVKISGVPVIVAVVIAASLILFSSNPLGLQNGKAVAQETSKSKEGLQIGNTAPDFKLTVPVKGTVTKQTFNGKPLFIFFTATYCTECQIGAENLGKYDDDTGGSAFNVLAVFIDDSETDNQFIEWKQKYGRDDWYVAKGLEMAKTYNVKHTDTKYIFDKSGIIRWFDDVRPFQYSNAKPLLGPLL